MYKPTPISLACFVTTLLIGGCAPLPELPTTPIVVSDVKSQPSIAPEKSPTPEQVVTSPTAPKFSPQTTPQFNDVEQLELQTSSSAQIETPTPATLTETPETSFVESVVVTKTAAPTIAASTSTPSSFGALPQTSGTSVSFNEQPLDSQCPDIQELEPLASGGCTLTLDAQQAVTFFINSDVLTKGAFSVLENVAAAFSKSADLLIEIDAHSDSRGDATQNLELSKRRGKTVALYLLSSGFSKEQIVAKAFAGENPIASNNTVSGRRSNRRVEIRFFP